MPADSDGLWSRARLEAMWERYEGDDPPDSPRGKKRTRLIEAATELFLKHGYRKTSVDEIARKAHVAKGTVYTFFDTKNDLLVAAIAAEKRVMLKILDPILSGTLAPKKRLRFYVRVLLTAVRELPLSMRMMQGGELAAILADMNPEALAAQRELGLNMLGELIEQAAPGRHSRKAIRRRATVMQSFAMLTPWMSDAEVRQGTPFEEYVNSFEEVLVAGLVAPSTDES